MPDFKVISKWFGDQIEKEIIDALKEGVDESTEGILKDARANCPRVTGALAESGQRLPAKVGQKEVYGRVIFGGGKIQYALWPELKTRYLRRALVANENSSLLNFEGKLGFGKRKKAK